jgi:hypothetical protein
MVLLYSMQVYRWLMQITFFCSLLQLILVMFSIWEGEDFLYFQWIALSLSVVSLVVSAMAFKIVLRIYSNSSLSGWIRSVSGATAVFAFASVLQSISVICLQGMDGSVLFDSSSRSIRVWLALSGSTFLALKFCDTMELASKVSKMGDRLRRQENQPPERLEKLNQIDRLMGDLIGRPHTD